MSVETQLEVGRRYALDHGWDLVGEFYDDGRSGKLDRRRRPGLDAALKLVESGGADILITLWTNRLSRVMEQWIKYLDVLEGHGVEWHATAEGGLIDRKSAMTRFMTNQRAAWAEFQSDLIGENWARVHQKRLDSGLPKVNSPRFGYRWDKTSRTYVIEESEAKVVRELYRRYVRGDGFTPLVRWLHANGWKTTRGKDWSVRTLNRFMDSGFAAGFISKEADFRDRRGAHEVLVSETEWFAYEAERARRKAESKTRPSGSSTRWWLAGFVKCSCGGSTYVDSYDRPSSLVCCITKRNSPDLCSGRSILRTYVESAVGLWLGGHLNLLDQLAQAESNEVENAALSEYTAAVSAEKKALTMLSVLEDRRDDPDDPIDPAVYRATHARRTAALAEARKAVRRAGSDVEKAKRDQADTAKVREGAAHGWGDDHRAALRQVLDQVEIHHDGLTIIPVSGDPTFRSRADLAPRCGISGCSRVHYTRGLCKSHTMRARKVSPELFDALVARVAESEHDASRTLTVEDVESLMRA